MVLEVYVSIQEKIQNLFIIVEEIFIIIIFFIILKAGMV